MAATSNSTMVPVLRYKDALRAIEWLVEVFGFEKQMVVPGPNDTVAHAQLTFGGSTIMLASFADDSFGMKSPQDVGCVTQAIYVVIEDVDAHHERAKAGGAEIVREIDNTDYGSREYMARDVEGHLWSFGTYEPGREA